MPTRPANPCIQLSGEHCEENRCYAWRSSTLQCWRHHSGVWGPISVLALWGLVKLNWSEAITCARQESPKNRETEDLIQQSWCHPQTILWRGTFKHNATAREVCRVQNRSLRSAEASWQMFSFTQFFQTLAFVNLQPLGRDLALHLSHARVLGSIVWQPKTFQIGHLWLVVPWQFGPSKTSQENSWSWRRTLHYFQNNWKTTSSLEG